MSQYYDQVTDLVNKGINIVNNNQIPIEELKKKFNSIYNELQNFVLIGSTKFKLNVLLSDIKPTDKRIKNYGFTINFPSSFDLRDKLLPVRNQGRHGSCVAFSLSVMKEHQEIKSNNFNDYLSPWFIYLQREDQRREGMSVKNALDILKSKGVCTEVEFPYEKAKSKNEITNVNYENAKNFTISDYAVIESIDQLKYSLYNNGVCIIALPCYNTFSRFWKKESDSQQLLGGHCVTVCGYDIDKGFLIRNSWGTFWGENGYTWMPYDDWGSQFEIWSSIDVSIPTRLVNYLTTPTGGLSTEGIVLLVVFLVIVLFGILYFLNRKYNLLELIYPPKLQINNSNLDKKNNLLDLNLNSNLDKKNNVLNLNLNKKPLLK